jgi:hypothetical protein
VHYPDLSPCDHFPFDSQGKVVAVGWLESGQPYRDEEISREFVERLAELSSNPWQPFVAMGVHQCGFCRLTGGPGSFPHGGSSIAIGVSNVFIPGDGFLYVAPSLILHYMDAHGYAPPDEFQAAVVRCPAMRSMEYLKAVLANGPAGLSRTTN